MNQERDKFIFDWFGECPHQEWDDGLDIDGHDVEPFCKQCGYKDIPYYTINLSTWDGFGWLWGMMVEHKKWEDFCTMQLNEGEYFSGYRLPVVLKRLINRDRFADAVREFLQTLGKSYSEFLRKENKR